MEGLHKMDSCQRLAWLAGGVVTAAVAVITVKRIFFQHRRTAVPNPRDVVILHQIGRGGYAPSLSPFPLKLETYLRMAKIPYQSVHSFRMSTKRKTPWIEYNEDTVADSGFCIEYLNDKFGLDLNKNLSKEERAVARAFEKLNEDALYWSLVMYRWIYPVDRSIVTTVFGMPWFVKWKIQRNMKKTTWAQGTGRHVPHEVDHLIETDLRAISEYLGKKKFFFGDTATEVDCSLFGILCQPIYHMPGLKPHTMIKEKFPNLIDYCNRIRVTFWPDWEDKITNGRYCGVGPNSEIREQIIRP
ncbi:failed axon connections homolog [Gigantopelta aegis]|uniref:failed axon connections homolog n=1 Tax=Gigantopelta aegis TaxID=1735272 RepID=UPI001B88B81A|nr:failed axon connections homolog [Gigantopelta aegis]